MTKAGLIVISQLVIAQQQLITAQQQLGEIHHTLALTLFIVGRENFNLSSRIRIGGLHLVCALPALLAPTDKISHLARCEFLIIHIQRLH